MLTLCDFLVFERSRPFLLCSQCNVSFLPFSRVNQESAIYFLACRQTLFGQNESPKLLAPPDSLLQLAADSSARLSRTFSARVVRGSFAVRVERETEREAQQILAMPNIMEVPHETDEPSDEEWDDIVVREVMRSSRQHQSAHAKARRMQKACMWEALSIHALFADAMAEGIRRKRALTKLSFV